MNSPYLQNLYTKLATQDCDLLFRKHLELQINFCLNILKLNNDFYVL